MSSRHANISVFVPHIGCPNMCSFCDQRHITGTDNIPSAQDVINAVGIATASASYDPKQTEIAFFGGSFTAIDREYMLTLLKAAFRFVEDKTVSGIRISTRPDAIDDEILLLLKKYGVTAIELGAQSLNDSVLKANNRGHSVQSVTDACALIKKHGFSLGLQMMTGLYLDTDEDDLATLEKIISLKPETLRIYPTIVLAGTRLAELYSAGLYRPQELEAAVLLSAKMLKMLQDTDIKLIRLGLHSIDLNAYVAGPWHPAFSELCYSRLMLERAVDMLSPLEKGDYIIHTNSCDISKMTGQKRMNIQALKELGYNCRIVGDNPPEDRGIRIERSSLKCC